MDLTRLTGEVEEISRLYADRHGIERDDTWFLLKLHEEVGELTQAFLMRTGQARSKGRSRQEIEAGFRAEFADVLCHVLLMARYHGVDLPVEVERKWLTRHPNRAARSTGQPAAECRPSR